MQDENAAREIQITDVLGNVVLKSKYENGIDVDALSAGIYFISFQDENGNRLTEKVVKQ